jgi:PIN domain nuclease of toxin-antitoxin system
VTGDLPIDTHIALWPDNGAPHLRPSTGRLIDACWQDGGTIYLSAISAWEIALLVDTGRIDLDLPALRWVARFIGRPGVAAAAFDWRAASGA